MRYLEIDKFRTADHRVDPFQFTIVPEFLSAERLKEVNADFPGIEKAGNSPIQDLAYGPHFKAFIEEIKSSAFREAIEEKFNIDLRGLDHLVSTRAFSHKTDGNIHADAPAKIMTALIYLNEDYKIRLELE